MEIIKEYLLELWLIPVSGVSAFILINIVLWQLRHLFRRLDWSGYESFIRLRRPLVLIAVLIGISISTSLKVEELPLIWSQIFRILYVISFAWLMIRSTAAVRHLIAGQYDLNTADNLRARKVITQLRVFERILNVVIIIVAVSLILMTFDSIRNLGTSLLASAGVAGLIVGLAAQRVIGNLLAGLQIAITQPIRLDDAVVIDNEWGWIEEITLTYVVVRIWDRRRLIVPSSSIIEKTFQNWTRTNSDILGTVFIYADYKLPVQPLREALTEILNGTDLWNGQVNVLQVTNLTEKSMELRALMSAKNSPTAWDLRVYVREKIIEFLQKEYPDCLPKSRIELKDNN